MPLRRSRAFVGNTLLVHPRGQAWTSVPVNAAFGTPRSLYARPVLSVGKMKLAADMQSFRDGFRTLFFPGVGILSLGLPFLLIGVLVGKPSSGEAKDTNLKTKRSSLLIASNPLFQEYRFSKALVIKLTASIILDLIGDGSLLVPGLCEVSDFLWAPVSAAVVRLLYGNNVLAAVNLLEELLPSTDIIPTATIAFLLDFFWHEEGAQSPSKEGRARPATPADVIDAKVTSIRDKNLN